MGQMVAMQEMIGEISEKSRGDWDGSNGSNAREMIGESMRAK